MKDRLFAASAALLASAAYVPVAAAAPVVFTFTGTIGATDTPFVNVGDTLKLELTADNGGNSLSSQTWNLADLQGFSVVVGGYTATYSKVFEFPETSNFQTDDAGNVITSQFYGTSYASSNTDIFGSSVGDIVFGDATFYSTQHDFLFDVSGNFTNPGQWTVALAGGGVPEPATWALMILGFGAVGGAMRRRHSVAAKVRFA